VNGFVPDQEPVEAVSVWPCTGVPEIVGGAVFFGASTFGPTIPVARERAVLEPDELLARTDKTIRLPTSGAVSV
jgi:hypothetical protein